LNAAKRSFKRESPKSGSPEPRGTKILLGKKEAQMFYWWLIWQISDVAGPVSINTLGWLLRAAVLTGTLGKGPFPDKEHLL